MIAIIWEIPQGVPASQSTVSSRVEYLNIGEILSVQPSSSSNHNSSSTDAGAEVVSPGVGHIPAHSPLAWAPVVEPDVWQGAPTGANLASTHHCVGGVQLATAEVFRPVGVAKLFWSRERRTHHPGAVINQEVAVSFAVSLDWNPPTNIRNRHGYFCVGSIYGRIGFN